jgi:16S rRNA (guanine527-N7)-methyltransferase
MQSFEAKPNTAHELERLIAPALLQPLQTADYQRLARYMELLYRWNARMNLTAVRDQRVFARVHLAECLLAAQLIPKDILTALDFGSGAGLPGIPMAVTCPQLTVTLAESQGKKAAFLRETVRELELRNATVFADRVENASPEILYDLVTLRAVDKMERALRISWERIRQGGWCFALVSEDAWPEIEKLLPGFEWQEPVAVPGTVRRQILRGRKHELE